MKRHVMESCFSLLLVALLLLPTTASIGLSTLNSKSKPVSNDTAKVAGTDTVWHDDCSSTTGFTYNDSWNINWMPWTFQQGTLKSNGSMLSIANAESGVGYHGPLFEHELPSGVPLRYINGFSAVLHVDNSLPQYAGYYLVMLGDQNRNPVLFFSFSDIWSGFSQGEYGVSYVSLNGSLSSFGSASNDIWTSFSGTMNVSVTDQGLLAGVEGVGNRILPGLTDIDFNRTVKYVAIASARYMTDQMLPVLVDDMSLTYVPAAERSSATVSHPPDMTITPGSTDTSFNWIVTGPHPGRYQVFLDGSMIRDGTWASGASITITGLGLLGAGEHNYTLAAFDASGHRVVDSVMVQVIPPWYASAQGILAIGIAIGGLAVIVILGWTISRHGSGSTEISDRYYSQ